MYKNMKPGARLSLSFFNQDANLFANAIYGNFDYIAKVQPAWLNIVNHWVSKLSKKQAFVVSMITCEI